MTKTTHIDLGIGFVSIFENYLIMEINQGETVTVEDNQKLIKLTETFYSDQEFVYITNRVNSYAVNPAVYFETKKIKNLIGFAVVSEKEIDMSNALIEKLFFDKPFEMFKELDEAISWANTLCSKSKKI
ncbi:hypothetical protein Q4512_13825 [Oceanihabitans sp. 2_MG-2023]|uniref:hypothetical protein n=1 Tax=Oceanihabitans sp. 2_MG-2023 TaxID=3062661 RepID=UPI0026E4291D|nr:hypothetical protein [Oceanihabitans sp. 2_MG-2023]MDO6597999.1 hypothetical protein [Oceanihabitans sp. 2_MG-2023]